MVSPLPPPGWNGNSTVTEASSLREKAKSLHPGSFQPTEINRALLECPWRGGAGPALSLSEGTGSAGKSQVRDG